jgi:hypothetical protein
LAATVVVPAITGTWAAGDTNGDEIRTLPGGVLSPPAKVGQDRA